MLRPCGEGVDRKMTRSSLCMIPPLFAYHVVNPRGGAVVTPWYLAGGVSAANCVAAYQPIGAADYAASKVNLANPGTYNATDGAEYPTWDDTNGWKFDHTTGDSQTLYYIALGSSAEYSAILRFSNVVQGIENGYALTTNGTSNNLNLQFRAANSQYRYHTTQRLNAFDSGGVVAWNKVGIYVDGSPSYSWTPASDTITPASLRSQSVSTGLFYLQALAIYNTTLTGDQVAAITTAMNALTSESRMQSLEGLLEFEPEEEKLWWEGADLVEAAAQVIEAPKAPELTRWQRATNVASDALDKAKKWIDSKLYQLWQAIEDYFDYHEEE